MIRLWKDIERCPYVSSDPEYTDWIARDRERLAQINNFRKELLIKAYQYISHEDRNIRNMAHFVIGILDDKEPTWDKKTVDVSNLRSNVKNLLTQDLDDEK